MKTSTLLTSEQIELAKRLNDELIFSKDFDLIYEKQILPGIVILLNGEIQYLKNGIHNKITASGSVIGLKSIRKRFKYQLRIKAGSRILLVGFSGLKELQEILEDEKVSKGQVRN